MQIWIPIQKFLKHLFKSVMMSLVISLAGYCLLTRTFPPDFSRLERMYKSYKELTAMTAQIKKAQNQMNAGNGSLHEVDEEKQIQEILDQKKKMQDLLAGFNLGDEFQKKPEDKKALSEFHLAKAIALQGTPGKMILISKVQLDELNEKIKQLNNTNFHLNRRLVEMQSKQRVPAADVPYAQPSSLSPRQVTP